MLFTPSPLSQTVTPSRTPSPPSSVTYCMDGPLLHASRAPLAPLPAADHIPDCCSSLVVFAWLCPGRQAYLHKLSVPPQVAEVVAASALWSGMHHVPFALFLSVLPQGRTVCNGLPLCSCSPRVHYDAFQYSLKTV